MKTQVTFIYDYNNIELPEAYREIDLPPIASLVETQCELLAKEQSKIDLPEGQHHVLTDEMVKEAKIPGVETVEDYKKKLEHDLPVALVSDHAHIILTNYLVPQLVQRSTFEIDDEEATAAGKDYYNALEESAAEQGITFRELAAQHFGPNLDEGEIRQYVHWLGRSHYLFRVLAREYYRRQGILFDLASYVNYVADIAKMMQKSEEEVKAMMPLNVYMDNMPAMLMMDEMTAWLAPQLSLKTGEKSDAGDAKKDASDDDAQKEGETSAGVQGAEDEPGNEEGPGHADGPND